MASAPLLALIALMAAPGTAVESTFSPGTAGFTLKVGQETCGYEVLAYPVLPGASLSLQVVGPAEADDFEARHGGEALRSLGVGAWVFTASAKAGLYPIIVTQRDSGAAITVNVFVVVPRSAVSDGTLNGYAIGHYPEEPYKDLAIYSPPEGFVEVTAENRKTLVSPHFRLEQFLCKQAGGWPKYIVMRPRLFLKLEHILARANEAGYRCDTLQVMSGYRTPHYNAAIGNVKYSRHVWGGAADIFIDADGDGMMDDLNRDGQSTVADAALLYELVDGMYGQDWYKRFWGGLGRYRKTAAHGPFVHVDVRGFRARWGS